ncbi:YceI family protein [Gynurincola endophyticus]|jgi:polyisoprenoid-binding protein YceI|uniref:YceI family protein n=1 Tax=Gynurincola endophyticus TaxID=2479004 RepID=UPI000F8EF5A8|nr:YceI family protein [Gynurincola endophyticus]
MKRSRFSILKYLAIASLLLPLIAFSALDLLHRWNIRDHYNIKFIHPDAEGIFKKFEGTVLFDETQPQNAHFDVNIDVHSVEAGNPARNESIRNGWLNGEKYPKIHFVAKGAEQKEGNWQTSGELSLHGVTKPLALPFTFKSNGDSAVFEGNFILKMKDYNLSDEPEETIQVELRIPVSKQ